MLESKPSPASPKRKEPKKIHPIEMFFDYRAAIHNIDHNFEAFIENSFFRNIPVLDKTKRITLASILANGERKLKTVFETFRISSKFEFSKTFEIPQFIKASKHYAEVRYLELGYLVFTYSLDKNCEKNEETFTRLFSLLKNITEEDECINAYTDYIFKKLMSTAFSPKISKTDDASEAGQNIQIVAFDYQKNQNVYSKKTISLVQNFVLLNPSLSRLNSITLFHFFQHVKETKDPILIRDMKLAILHMALKKYPVLVDCDGTTIIPIISDYLKELDDISLQIIAQLTHSITSRMIIEAFMLLPLPLLTMVNSSSFSQNETFSEPDQTKVEQFERVSFTNLPLHFISTTKPECSLKEGFKLPDYSLIEEQQKIEDLIPKQLLVACDKISKCLIEAENSSLDYFIYSYIPLLESSRGTFHHLEICAAFIYIITKITSVYPAQNLIVVIFNTAIFNPALTIFNKEEPLNNWINTMRNTVFELIAKSNQAEARAMLEKAETYPLLFAEFLIRILYDIDSYQLTMFTNEKTLHSIVENAHMLYYLQENKDVKSIDIVAAREINFIFLFMLATNQSTQCTCFSSKFFTDGFLWFIFEPDMTERIIHLIRDSLSKISFSHSLEMTASYIVLLFKSFQTNYEENKEVYRNAAEQLASELITGLQLNNSNVVSVFEIVLQQMLRFLQVIDSPTIVEACFQFLDILSQRERGVDINISMLKYLCKAVKNCYNSEPPTSIRSHIQYLISGQFLPIGDTSFLIKCTSAIPLLISCFSCSKKFESILDQCYKLCKFSAYNRSAFHNGDLDFILLRYINQREAKTTILYNGVEIEFSVQNKESVDELIFSLLMEISTQKSNACIVSQYIDLITKFPKVKEGDEMVEQVDETATTACKTISVILQKCYSKPTPSFPIGTIHPQFVVSNIPISSISHGFTIHFQLFVDIKAHDEAGATLNLFTFKDNSGTSLTFAIKGHNIIATFETADAMADVQFDKKIQKTWFDFALSCSYSYEYGDDGEEYQDMIMIPYINGQREIEYKLGSAPFIGQTLTMFVGGSEGGNRTQIRSELGSIGDIKIINCALDNQGVQNLIHGERNKSIEIFSSNQMMSYQEQECDTECEENYSLSENYSHDSAASLVKKAPALPDIHTVTKSLSFGSLANVDSTGNSRISVTMCSGDEAVAHDFLWCFVDSGFINDITWFFDSNAKCKPDYPSYLLDIINIIFTVSEKSQSQFHSVSSIQRFLYLRPDVLSWHTFSCTYSVLKSIRNKSFFVEWLTKIVLNMWIWVQCNAEHVSDMVHIFQYFARFLVKQFEDTLKTVSNLSILADQFYLFFCFKNEEEFLQGKTDKLEHESDLVKDLNIESLSKNPKSLLKCRDQIFNMICSIIPHKCDRFDIQTFIIHLFSSKGTITKLNFMKFLCYVPNFAMNNFNQRDETLTMLRPILTMKDPEMIATCIFLSIKLAAHDMIIPLSVSSIITAKFIPHVEIFDKLITRIRELPDLHHCLCILAISAKGNTNKPLQDVYAMLESRSDEFLITLCENWFVWPIIFSFANGDLKEQEIIGRFIGKNLVKLDGQRMKTDLTRIFVLTDLLLTFSNMKSESLIISILRIFYQQDRLDPLICQTLLDMVFMHMRKRFHNDALLMFWKQSCFYDKSFEYSFVSHVNTQDLRTPDAFDVFICSDFNGYAANFCVPLNENESWIYSEKAQLVMDIIRQFQMSDQNAKLYKIFMTHFLRDEQTSSVDSEEVLKKLNSFVDEANAKYSETFSTTLNDLRSSVHLMIIEAHKIADCEMKYSNLVISNPTNNVNERDMKLQEEYFSMSNIKLQVDIQEAQALNILRASQPTVFKRDRTACACLCPMKLKKVEKKTFRKVVNKNHILYQHSCTLIKFAGKHNYNFQLYKNEIKLTSQDHDKSIPTDMIYMVLTRRIEGRETGIEIYTLDGCSYLIDFVTTEHPDVINALFILRMPKIQILQRMVSLETFSRLQVTQRWVSGFVSNFEYIVKMNIIAGRSFNDPVMYPIFPSILTSVDNIVQVVPFTHFKQWNPPMLDRLVYPHSKAPLTPLSETVASNRFVAPEFFYFPHVIDARDTLPRWASSKFEFVYLHRKLLESQAVSSILNQWIDSIFGMRAIRIPHRQLFRTPHPQRKFLSPKKKLVDFMINTNIGSRQIVYMSVIQQDPGCIKYQTIFDDGTINKSEIILNGNFTNTNSGASSSANVSPSTSSNLLLSQQQQQKQTSQEQSVLASKPPSIPLSFSQSNIKKKMPKSDSSDSAFASSDISFKRYKKIGYVGKGQLLCDTYDGFLVVVSPEKQTVHFINNSKVSELSILSSDTSLIAAGENKVLFCPNRTSVSLIDVNENAFNTNIKNIMNEEELEEMEKEMNAKGTSIYQNTAIRHQEVMCRVKSSISCIAYEPRYKVFVVCMTNNIATIYNSRNKREICSYDCKETILKVMVTNSLGFIVIQCIHSIILLSIDGEFIKKAALPAEIVNWWQFTSSKGFDYVVFQDSENKIGFFEAFYPEHINRFYETRSRVCHVSYDVFRECFIILTHDGLIQFCFMPLE